MNQSLIRNFLTSQATAAPPTAIPTIARRLRFCTELNSVFLHVIAHGNVTLLVDDDWRSFLPSWAVVFNPDSSGPFADVVSARENAGSLDVSDLDDVLVFGENVAKLLACRTVTHGAVDVF